MRFGRRCRAARDGRALREYRAPPQTVRLSRHRPDERGRPVMIKPLTSPRRSPAFMAALVALVFVEDFLRRVQHGVDGDDRRGVLPPFRN